MNTYDAIFAAAAKMIRGEVVHAKSMTAGNGKLVDWRHVKSGDEIMSGADAFDVAQVLVETVGPSAVLEACGASDV